MQTTHSLRKEPYLKERGKANHPFSAKRGGREEGPLTSIREEEESSLL